MRKRYYLSMLSIFVLILLFDAVYIPAHKSLELFLLAAGLHFVLFVPVNFLGIYFLYKPIDQLFLYNKGTRNAKLRIRSLSWYSSTWIFFLGVVYFGTMILMIYLAQVETGNVAMNEIPSAIWLTAIPSILYIFAILPAFIAWFIINDFTLDLKSVVFNRFKLSYPAGTQRIGLTLLISFMILGLFPSILVSLELIVSSAGDKYGQFSDMSPLEGIIPDRVAIFLGMICAVIFITRSFTKPIHALLKEMSKVKERNYTSKAAIITGDEIGILTHEFNDMVKGLHERELIRDTFGKYVPKDVATAILDKKINATGEVRTCTILFTDIENYSTIAEELQPAEVVAMLNEYFTMMVDIIQKHKGVVNEFVGDAVFAMFNVPFDDPDHASNAMKSALAIEQITAKKRFGKNILLKTRIGINTGVVVAGNIGAVDRLKYGVVGDEVNIAARLEQLNKKLGTSILAGENTYDLIKNEFDCKYLGDFQLKGKERNTKVYSVSI